MTTETKKSWHDVLMPPQIAAMDRDKRGYPIVHIIKRYPVLIPPPIDPDLGYIACDDTEEPLALEFGVMSEERQRRCWLDFRCQVCNADLRKKQKFVAGGLSDRPIDDFLFREPYVCHSCLGYALLVCPGLVCGARTGDLRVLRVASNPILYAERVGADQVPRVHRMVFDLQSICMYLRAQFHDGTVMTPDKFLESWRATAA